MVRQDFDIFSITQKHPKLLYKIPPSLLISQTFLREKELMENPFFQTILTQSLENGIQNSKLCPLLLNRVSLFLQKDSSARHSGLLTFFLDLLLQLVKSLQEGEKLKSLQSIFQQTILHQFFLDSNSANFQVSLIVTIYLSSLLRMVKQIDDQETKRLADPFVEKLFQVSTNNEHVLHHTAIKLMQSANLYELYSKEQLFQVESNLRKSISEHALPNEVDLMFSIISPSLIQKESSLTQVLKTLKVSNEQLLQEGIASSHMDTSSVKITSNVLQLDREDELIQNGVNKFVFLSLLRGFIPKEFESENFEQEELSDSSIIISNSEYINYCIEIQSSNKLIQSSISILVRTDPLVRQVFMEKTSKQTFTPELLLYSLYPVSSLISFLVEKKQGIQFDTREKDFCEIVFRCLTENAKQLYAQEGEKIGNLLSDLIQVDSNLNDQKIGNLFDVILSLDSVGMEYKTLVLHTLSQKGSKQIQAKLSKNLFFFLLENSPALESREAFKSTLTNMLKSLSLKFESLSLSFYPSQLSMILSFLTESLSKHSMDITLLRRTRFLLFNDQNQLFPHFSPQFLATVHDLLISHPNFFDSLTFDQLVQVNSEISLISSFRLKRELVLLLRTIYECQNSLCKSVEVFRKIVGGYGGSASVIDRNIVAIMVLFEKQGITLAETSYLFGKTAYSRLVHSELSTDSILAQKLFFEGIFDKERLMYTLDHFPENMGLLELSQKSEEKDWKAYKLYDPFFVLPFLNFAISQLFVMYDQFADFGMLSFTIRALSSSELVVRKSAYEILSIYFKRITDLRFHGKLLLFNLLNSFKNAVLEENKRIPALLTTFLSKAVFILRDPTHNLFLPVNNFLSSKAFLDLNVRRFSINYFCLFFVASINYSKKGLSDVLYSLLWRGHGRCCAEARMDARFDQERNILAERRAYIQEEIHSSSFNQTVRRSLHGRENKA